MAAEAELILNRDVRDGVPVHWAPAPEPCMGVLRFRAGWADESPIERGLTHLVEHLALHGFGAEPGFALNGLVDALDTIFWARGSADQVVTFMERVCAALAQLPEDRVEAESRVLRTEALGRQSGITSKLLNYRFGARGLGMDVIDEHALLAPDPARVRGWAARRFTAGNAVAWFSGPLPDRLRFPGLPPGERLSCPELVPVSGLQPPTFVREALGGVAISVVSPREDWLSIPLSLVCLRLQQRLRYEQGVTYGVESVYSLIGPRDAHGVIWAKCLPEQERQVERAMFEVLEQVAHEGPTPDELKRVREPLLVDWSDPASVQQQLEYSSLNELLGGPSLTHAELVSEFDSRDASAWAGVIARALETALLVIPPGTEPSRVPCRAYPMWSESAVEGRDFRNVGQRFPWSEPMPKLVIGREGVSVVSPEGACVTVRYASCVGAVAFPDERIWLCDGDGFGLLLDPRHWRDGARARELVMGGLPGDRLLVVRV